MISYFIFEFDPNTSAFVCVADVSVVDSNGINRLHEIRVFTLDMNHVA